VYLQPGLEWQPPMGEFLYYVLFGCSEAIAGDGDDWPCNLSVCCRTPLVFLGVVLVVCWGCVSIV